jgi:ABC-type Fe3+/spermidine/putrescine transport system ATPase subunit
MGDTMQKAIEVTNLCKRYSQEVLKNFSLSVNEGEMVVLLGESGCGKSTFIRILAGLENADSGSVCLNGISMDERIPPNKRNIALVYQEPVLWNHMPVWKNIAYGMAKKDKKVIYELMDALEIGGLEKRFPEEISGGQAKRVALARALAADKGILLLDEPLSNIDEKTKLKNLEYLVQNYKE